MGAKPGKVIMMGWIDRGNVPRGGETAKNQHMLAGLEACGLQVVTLDFYRWKHHPGVLLKTLWWLAAHPRTPLILTSSPKNVYPLIRLHSMLRSRRRVIHWVIGGNMHRFLESGEFSAKALNSVSHTIVETGEMLRSLQSGGVTNAMRLPNFKHIGHMPPEPARAAGGRVRFVFLSRVMPQKGTDLILDSVAALNARGLADRYEVDFYGPVGDDYRADFDARVASLPNVAYRGFLDMTRPDSYDLLSGYTAMLFPTTWVSEGFAGVIVDAFTAGLPVIATRWAGNPDIIEDGVNGLLIDPGSGEALTGAMRRVIDGDTDIPAMRRACREHAMRYDTSAVVTPELLARLGLQ